MPLISKAFSNLITFSRTGGAATYFAANGVLTTAANNEPRFDYDPATFLPRGLLIEEQRTNSIRNNTMQGAVAGTPGTLPQVSGSPIWTTSLAGGLSREVVSVSSINGINYIDIRIFGTTTNTNLALNVYLENALQIAALTGQTWTESAWVQMVGGSTTGISQIYLAMVEISSGGVDLAYLTGSDFKSTIGTFTRRSYTATTSNASTAFIRPALWVSHTGIGAAIDITLRIGLPQLELGAFATSVIPTTTTALTRSADVASVNTLSPWFNATEGTLFAEYVRLGATNFQAVAYLGTPAQTDYAGLVFGSGAPSNNQRFDVGVGGLSQASITVLTSPALNTVSKTAGAYKANDFAATANGAAPGVDPSGSIPTVTALGLGTATALTGPYLNGYLRRITYYPTRLSNAQLQTITT